MNKFRIYILTIIGTILFGCSQQNEASRVEEAAEEDMVYVTDEKAVSPGVSYNWETSEIEQNLGGNYSVLDDRENQEAIVLEDAEESNGFANIVNEKDKINSGIVNEENAPTTGSISNTQVEESQMTKTKFLKGFVRQNIEDLIDLTALYLDNSMGEEVNEIAKQAIEERLHNLNFQELEEYMYLLNNQDINLKLKELSQLENGDYCGKVLIKNSGKQMMLSYQIIHKKTSLGTTKKFFLSQIE